MLADHTKFGRAATVLLAPLESIHTIVTDDKRPGISSRPSRARGLQVVLA